jgi:hypothetical protein
MSNLFASLAIATATSGTFCATSILTSDAAIPLKDALGLLAFVAGLVWWLSRRFQNIDDRLKTIERNLDNRPCQKHGDCALGDTDEGKS